MKNLHETPAMPDTMLSEHHRYWKGYIAHVDIELTSLPEQVALDNEQLLKKEEFHISLIDTSAAANIINPEAPQTAEPEIIKDFKEFIKQDGLERFRLLEEFRVVTKGERKTVVVMCEVPGADKFFDELSRKYGAVIPMQPFHITLYTRQPNGGIGIASDQELAEISVPVNIPELNNIRAT